MQYLNNRTVAFSLLVLLLTSGRACADSSDDWARMRLIQPKGYVCYRADKPVNVDGKLDDEVWQAAPWTDDFLDIEGDAKPRPRFRTRAKMLWDAEYFYVAALLEEPHVWGTLTRHDAVIFQDNDFEIFIDPNGDNHQYYEFEVNALNSGWDLFLPRPYKDGGEANNDWEIPGLKTAVHVTGTLNDPSDRDECWSVEIVIPWSALREFAHRTTPPQDGDQWRVNFSRVEWQHEVEAGKYRKVPKTREDNWVWSPQGIIDMHRPERWGFVQFSTAAPGTASFKLDPAWQAREMLMTVYHHQKAFFQKHQRWADTLDELALKDVSQQLVMRATAEGFQADVELTRDHTTPWLRVRQDSRITQGTPHKLTTEVKAALERAGDNRGEVQQALDRTPAEQQAGIRFLVAYMPERDLKSLSADTLVENVQLAYQAWDEAHWKNDLPEEIFLNNVLPYANINEQRDDWRRDFYQRFKPLVKDAASPSEAAAILNQKVFPLLNVRYSTKRNRADQGPHESIKSGLASCTGLSILLIDACRAIGVPARFAGTPLWADKSGNHSWVEIWDNGWHFTGAAEPTGNDVDKAWFGGRAATAQRDHPLHAIYAVSYKPTPQAFPLVWEPTIDYVFAVNVTDRYTQQAKELAEGQVEVQFRAIDGASGERCGAPLKLLNAAGQVVFEGKTKDERFDTNDHLSVVLRLGKNYRMEVRHRDAVVTETITAEQRDRPVTLRLVCKTEEASQVDENMSRTAVEQLKAHLAQVSEHRLPIADKVFASIPLTRADATRAKQLLWEDHVATIRLTRAAEMEARELAIGDLKMPFYYKTFGKKPAGGRSLYISLHGGGETSKQANDHQWKNQKRLYRLDEGVYVAPRAPTNTWNLWHQGHIDGLFDRLIENMIVLEDVNPDRVYLMGYSAGGDGVYQLAPRMADRWAAAAMMAGHPNETSPLGLRNIAFTLHVGELDAAYNRNKIARQWQDKLAALHAADPNGYVFEAKIYPNKGHWLDREDAAAIPWMAKHVRNPVPSRIVWKQDDVVHQRFYWLAIQPEHARARTELRAEIEGQNIKIQGNDLPTLVVRLDDRMTDLDKATRVLWNDQLVFEGIALRTVESLAKTLTERGDPRGMFAAELEVNANPDP